MDAAQTEFSDKSVCEVLPARVEGSELKQLFMVRLSERYAVPRENIIVIKSKEAYLPVWQCPAQFEDHSLDLFFNGVSNVCMNAVQLPFREKGWIETAQETLSDLRNPAAWLAYSQEVLASIQPHDTGSAGHFAEPVQPSGNLLQRIQALAGNPNAQLVALIAILVVLVYLFLR